MKEQFFKVTLLGVKFSFPCIEEDKSPCENPIRTSFIKHARLIGLFRAFVKELHMYIPREDIARENMLWEVLTDGHEFKPTGNIIRRLEQSIGIEQIRFWQNNDVLVITSLIAIRRFLPFSVLDDMERQARSYHEHPVHYGPSLMRFNRAMRIQP